MALVLTEPFNNFTAAPWTTAAGTPSIVTARTGTGAQLNASGVGDLIDYTIPSGSRTDTITVGFAYRTSSTGTSTILVLFSDAKATEHNRLRRNSDGSLTFLRGLSGLANTAAGTIVANTWYYIEVQVKLSDTVGTYEVRINGTAVLGPAINQDTRSGGTNTVYETVELSYPGFPGVELFDDLYIRNDALFQGDPTLGPVITGTGAITFGGAGTATAALIYRPTGTGAITFAGSGSATMTFLGGTGVLSFDGRGTARISPLIVTGVGHIAFAGRGDIDVEPPLDVYAPPEWAWLVLQPDGTPVGSLTAASGRRLTFQLDGSATASFTMPGDHPQTATIAEMATDLYVARNGRPLFRGRIGGSSETHAADTDSVSLTATDYRGLLDHRLLWPGSRRKFDGVDQADIAWQLIADAQALGDLGIKRGVGSVTGVERVREYTAGSGLGQTIKELGNIAGGFDWEVDADLAFNLYCPQRGRYPSDVPSAQPILTYGEEVVSITTTVDAGRYGNAVYFTGATDTDPVTAVGPSTPEVGRWELQRADPNATNQGTIAEEAEAELAASSQLISAVTVILQPDIWNPYRLWLGDIVRTVADVGRLGLDVRRRIVQIDVTLDDTGVEQVSLSIGATPPRLSDRLNSLHKRVSHLELAPGGGGGGGGGGDGGGGGIEEITSNDGTIVVTNPRGPTTNLVVAGGALLTVTNPRGPITDLSYQRPLDEETVTHLYKFFPISTGLQDYGFGFPNGGADWLSPVADPVTPSLLASQISAPGRYITTLTIWGSTTELGRPVPYNIGPVHGAFGGFQGRWFSDTDDPGPTTYTSSELNITAFDLANPPPVIGHIVMWEMTPAQTIGGHPCLGNVDVTVTVTRVG